MLLTSATAETLKMAPRRRRRRREEGSESRREPTRRAKKTKYPVNEFMHLIWRRMLLRCLSHSFSMLRFWRIYPLEKKCLCSIFTVLRQILFIPHTRRRGQRRRHPSQEEEKDHQGFQASRRDEAGLGSRRGQTQARQRKAETVQRRRH